MLRDERRPKKIKPKVLGPAGWGGHEGAPAGAHNAGGVGRVGAHPPGVGPPPPHPSPPRLGARREVSEGIRSPER